MKVVVKSVFQDMFTGSVYSAGMELDLDDQERVDDLVSRNLVAVVEEKKAALVAFEKEFEKKVLVEALVSIEAKATMNMKDETILSIIEKLDEEKTSALKAALGIEA